ncbi:quinon protein alcohol dehydrogenase-like superfamily [Aspergillus cavernicola]|uniref:Quinon protein alcohol dehydrogenase-like superfamily n=1 Tax=Aspergillus cavernicola TaxID=176166 RepID=A0ABR4IQC2_9EURO
MLVNPTAETRANSEGVSYVVARMDWYCELSQLLLKESTVDGGMSVNLRSKLEGQIVDLYSLLLSYLMKSVCSCYQNRVVKYFQNAIKLNDWEGSLKDIQDAENLVAQDATQYNTQQIRSDLEQLVSVAHDRQTKLLSNIQKAVQDQAALQVEMRREEEDNNMLKDLCLTDPRDDMDRIEQTKDKLLEGSSDWIFDREDFKNWIDGDEATIYWIKGEPGKGKTMLLIGIIKQMLQISSATGLVSFFFCQNTDPDLNNATAVLRGLIYQLAMQDRSLLSYIRGAYDSRGQSLLDDRNAFFALSKILSKMLDDPDLPEVYLIIDALDECQTDLDQLLELLTRHISSSRLRCLVSSRPRSEIRNMLANSNDYAQLDLGEDAIEEVTEVVEEYIDHEVEDLAKQKNYNDKLQKEVKDYLLLHADGTFLWVSLVCKQLRKTLLWKTPTVLKTFPSGLHALYERMMEEVYRSDKESLETVDYCRRILAAVTVAHRPLDLDDLGLVANLPPELTEDSAALEEVVDLCGNFLTVREDTIYFVHHSAKEYLSAHTDKNLFREGHIAVHSGIVSRALEGMSATLCRDIWDLRDPGCSIDDIDPPEPNPLQRIGYACVYWIEHICELDTQSQHHLGLCDNGDVDLFFREHFLHWLEALSLLESIQSAEQMIGKLENFLQQNANNTADLLLTVQDMKHFVEHHQYVMKNTPLQMYISLIFSPTSSRVRSQFEDQVPSWIRRRPLMKENWNLHLHPVNNSTDWTFSLAFFADQQTLVAGCNDGTIEIWNAKARVAERVLRGHSDTVWSVDISPDGTKLASGSEDKTVRIWNVLTGSVMKTLEGHADGVRAVKFSPNGEMVISGSYDETVRIWDVQTGDLQHTLTGHTGRIYSVVFLTDAHVASCGSDETIRVWDGNTGGSRNVLEPDIGGIYALCALADGETLAIGAARGVQIWHSKRGELLRTLAQYTEDVHPTSVAFSAIGLHLAAGFVDGFVRIWNPETGILQQTLQVGDPVLGIAISNDGQMVALTSAVIMHIWDTDIKQTQSSLTGHASSIGPLQVSPCHRWIVTGARDGTVGLWDGASGLIVQMLQGHGSGIWSLEFSRDGRRIASASNDSTVRIWDLETGGTIVHVLVGHTNPLTSAVFSDDGRNIVSGARDNTIRIWNTDTGRLVRTIETPCSFVVACSPDGRLIASGSTAGEVEIRDAKTGELRHSLVGSERTVWSLTFTPDGKYLASSNEGTIQIYSVESGTLQQTLETGTAQSLRFSEDRSRLFTNLGCIKLDWSLTQESSVNPTWMGYRLDGSKEWVLWNGKRLLRVPLQCPHPYHMVADQMIVVGYEQGRIVILEFHDNISPFGQQ